MSARWFLPTFLRKRGIEATIDHFVSCINIVLLSDCKTEMKDQPALRSLTQTKHLLQRQQLAALSWIYWYVVIFFSPLAVLFQVHLSNVCFLSRYDEQRSKQTPWARHTKTTSPRSQRLWSTQSQLVMSSSNRALQFHLDILDFTVRNAIPWVWPMCVFRYEFDK